MYQIGLFSKMNQITIKTLHHYDEIGLLKPAEVDSKTGYRYYSSGQFYALHRINFLKGLGLSLEEIQKIINGDTKEKFLLQKKAELLSEIAQKVDMLGQIEYYLADDSKSMKNYEVILKEIPEVIVISKRLVLDGYANLLGEMPKMGMVMEEMNCVCSKLPYCFSIYHDKEYRANDVDVEICEAVTELQHDHKGYIFKKVPQIKTAACVLHRGSYQTLPHAYYALTLWIERNGYRTLSLPRESYIDGGWNKLSENEWLTEIQFPVTRKN